MSVLAFTFFYIKKCNGVYPWKLCLAHNGIHPCTMGLSMKTHLAFFLLKWEGFKMKMPHIEPWYGASEGIFASSATHFWGRITIFSKGGFCRSDWSSRPPMVQWPTVSGDHQKKKKHGHFFAMSRESVGRPGRCFLKHNLMDFGSNWWSLDGALFITEFC